MCEWVEVLNKEPIGEEGVLDRRPPHKDEQVLVTNLLVIGLKDDGVGRD
jgi:hypothetical protein